MEAFRHLKSADGIEWLECAPLGAFPWLRHGFSTRRMHGGDFSLGNASSPHSAEIEQNRRRFYRAIGAELFVIAPLRQTHSAMIYHVVRGNEANPIEMAWSSHPAASSGAAQIDTDAALEGDGLMTADPGILLAIRTADCVPILMADPETRAIAAVHAGWRGALQGIVAKSVVAMKERFGSRPQNLRVAIGPSIRSCCYEVGEEVIHAFSERFPNSEEFFVSPSVNEVAAHVSSREKMSVSAAPRAHLDLIAVAKRQLTDAGALLTNIYVAPYCTACRTDLFFSHRKEGARAGRMMSVIAIRQ